MRRVLKVSQDNNLNDLIIFLGGKCGLCGVDYLEESKSKKKRTWQIHHRKYRCSECMRKIPHNSKKCPYCGGEPEKDSRHFKEKIPHIITRGKNKGKKSTKIIYHKREYYEYLRPIVLSRPEDFTPLHLSCHHTVYMMSRWKKENLERLYTLSLELKQE